MPQGSPLQSTSNYDAPPRYASQRLGLNDMLRSPAQALYPSASTPSPTPALSPKRRRLHLNPPLHAADPSSIVVADMQNESDALHILALASTRPNNVKGKGKGPVKALKDFPLVRLGIVSESQILQLSEIFFRCHHHLYVRLILDLAYDSPWSPRPSFLGRQRKLPNSRRMSATSLPLLSSLQAGINFT